MKDPFDFRQVLVKIEMFRLDIQNQDMFGMKTTNGAVALVSFGHKKFATRIPMRVLSEDWNFRADVMRRVQPTLAQDMCGHSRGGGFTMHAADNDPALSLHDRGERFGAPGRPCFQLARANENWIIGLDRRGIDNQFGFDRVLRTMLREKLETQPL